MMSEINGTGELERLIEIMKGINTHLESINNSLPRLPEERYGRAREMARSYVMILKNAQ